MGVSEVIGMEEYEGEEGVEEVINSQKYRNSLLWLTANPAL